MKTNYNKIIVVAILFCVSLKLSAQEENVDQLNREMTLEREYDPSVQDASKVNTLPIVKEPEVTKREIDYSSTTIPSTPQQEVSMLPSGKILAEMEYNKRRGYINLGAGNYTNLNGDFGYHLLNTDKNKLNMFVSHRSSNGNVTYNQEIPEGIDNKIKAKWNDNLAGINYLHSLTNATIKLGGQYGYSAFNYYGLPCFTQFSSLPQMQKELISTLDRTTNQVYQSILINAGINSNPGASTGYLIDLEYTNLSQKYGPTKDIDGMTEHSIRGIIDLNKLVATSQVVGVTANLNYLLYSSPLESYKNHLIGTLTPYYRIEGGNWDLQIGANVMFATGYQKKIFLSPNITTNIDLGKKTVFYLNAGGAIRSNSFYELAKINRYANPYGSGPKSKNKLNAMVGIKSGVVPGFWFDIFGGYQITDNDCFFVPSLYNNQEFGQALSLFMPDTKHFLGGISFKYAYQQSMELSLKGVYHNWNVTVDEEWYDPIQNAKAYGMPQLEITAGITLRPIDKFALNMNYQLASGRYSSPLTENKKMKDIHDLSIVGTYDFNDTFGIYVKLNNLLFQKYELYYGYPIQGFNAMAGININF